MDESGIEYLLKMVFDCGKFVSLKVVDQSTGNDITSQYAGYSYIAGVYADNGIQVEWTRNLPTIFEEMLGCWLWDETLMVEERSSNPDGRQMKCLFLDWSGIKK